MSDIDDLVRLQLDAFPEVARELTYKPVSGGSHTLGGTLRSPTAEELVGGLNSEARVLLLRAGDVTGAGITPANFDRVTDLDGREYAVQSWRWIYAGSSRAWFTAEVMGG